MKQDENIRLIESRLGYSFQNKELVEAAFVHKSLYHERSEIKESLERLEFFGDSLLNCLMSEHLMQRYADDSEGDLSKRRSRLVDTGALNHYLEKLNVLEFLRTSKKLRVSAKMRADLFEAILGAIYFDSGFERARQWLFFTLHGSIREIDASKACDFKGLLQAHLQKLYHKKPEYRLIEKRIDGFLMGAYFDGELLASGFGKSKKEGQMLAAKAALEVVDGKKE
jgi:ribonuclease III